MTSQQGSMFSPEMGYADLAATGQALSPLDGRYRPQTQELTQYLSEAALNRTRIFVEIEWMIELLRRGVIAHAPEISDAELDYLRALPQNFNADSIAELAQIEAETRHDVKAVEYYIDHRLEAARNVLGPDTVLPSLRPLVHIFATSEDINNLSYALNVQAAVRQVWLPRAQALYSRLLELAQNGAAVPMLARTHGQPATPVTMGKELAVFAYRLSRQLSRIEDAEYLGKMNGATGTWAAHRVALPQVPWPLLTKDFVERLGLTWNPLTTQIESHDWQSELYSDISRFGRIAHNLSTDCWTYISLGYFHQKLGAQGSTGSSTMPHKVNPIRFENAEANFEISCALLETLAQTLVTSRLQRDLTDSSTQRNIGVALGHSLVAIDNLTRGLEGIELNSQVMAEELAQHPEVLSEAIQQVMRLASLEGRDGMENPYERMKELTRGHDIDIQRLREFVSSLDLPEDQKQRLMELTPETYTGYAPDMVDWISAE